jgi:uncharacterized protein YceH (UPF0502 family)
MSLAETDVVVAVESLQDLRLARRIAGEGRVLKYRHEVYETLDLGNRETALLAVLLLRGPQTAGELRSRTQSLYGFDDLEAVETCLRRLMERPEPLVARLPVRPGTKEPRYAHLLGEVMETAPPPPESGDRITRLEAAVEALTREVADLRQQLTDFRKQFE